MTVEVVDKRNIERVLLSKLKDGDYFVMENALYVINTITEKQAYADCVLITTGALEKVSISSYVQQVSLVIEIHLT